MVITKKTIKELQGVNVGILYQGNSGLVKIGTGYVKVQDDWLFLYDKDRSGSGYNFAMPITKSREINKIVVLERLEDQVYYEIKLPSGQISKVLHKPEFHPWNNDNIELLRPAL